MTRRISTRNRRMKRIYGDTDFREGRAKAFVHLLRCLAALGSVQESTLARTLRRLGPEPLRLSLDLTADAVLGEIDAVEADAQLASDLPRGPVPQHLKVEHLELSGIDCVPHFRERCAERRAPQGVSGATPGHRPRDRCTVAGGTPWRTRRAFRCCHGGPRRPGRPGLAPAHKISQPAFGSHTALSFSHTTSDPRHFSEIFLKKSLQPPCYCRAKRNTKEDFAEHLRIEVRPTGHHWMAGRRGKGGFK